MKNVPDHMRFAPVSGIVGLRIFEEGEDNRFKAEVFYSQSGRTDRLVGRKLWIVGNLKVAKVRFRRDYDNSDDPIIAEPASPYKRCQLGVGDEVFGYVTNDYRIVNKRTGKVIGTRFHVHCVGPWSLFMSTQRQLEEKLQRQKRQEGGLRNLALAFEAALPLRRTGSEQGVPAPLHLHQEESVSDDNEGPVTDLRTTARGKMPAPRVKRVKPAKRGGTEEVQATV
jgi:hypothetical protein